MTLKQEVEIISNDKVTKLGGTLMIPSEISSKLPAVIIVAGSGPIDRDGNMGKMVRFRLYESLSENLSDNGIAIVLKCDKRGVEKSASKSDKDLYWRAGMWDLVEDVLGQYEFLATHESVDATKICIFGHSEGAITLPLIAKMIKSKLTHLPPLNYAIFVGGYAYNLDQCTRYQLDFCVRDIGEASGLKALIIRKALLGAFTSSDWKSHVKKSRDDKVKEFLASKEDFTSTMFGLQKFNIKWHREHLEYGEKVLSDLEDFEGNILAIGGSKDLQAPFNRCDPSISRTFAPKAQSVTSFIIPDMDHLFRIQEKPANMLRYVTEDMKTDVSLPVSTEMINHVAEWIKNI